MTKSLILSAAVLVTGIAEVYAAAPPPNTLNGAIYLEGNTTNIPDVATAVADIKAASAATATFLSTEVNTTANNGGPSLPTQPNGSSGGFPLNGYSGHDGSTIPSLLSSIGDSTTTDSNATAPVGSFVMDLRGTLTVATAGTYTFVNNNDDGGAFFINGNGTPGSGTELAQNDGDHGPQGQSSTLSLTPGSYAIEYVAYNQACGGCGFTGNADNSGGGVNFVADIFGPNGVSDVSTSAVPEPSTWVAAGGLLLLAAGDFRRRLRA